MEKEVFTYIWEYQVNEEFLNEFSEIYGPDGEWAQLFRKAYGYLKTELHQDAVDEKRFVTIDYWRSREDRDNFRVHFEKEFKSLDLQCERLTRSEKLLGDFYLLLSPDK